MPTKLAVNTLDTVKPFKIFYCFFVRAAKEVSSKKIVSRTQGKISYTNAKKAIDAAIRRNEGRSFYWGIAALLAYFCFIGFFKGVAFDNIACNRKPVRNDVVVGGCRTFDLRLYYQIFLEV